MHPVHRLDLRLFTILCNDTSVEGSEDLEGGQMERVAAYLKARSGKLESYIAAEHDESEAPRTLSQVPGVMNLLDNITEYDSQILALAERYEKTRNSEARALVDADIISIARNIDDRINKLQPGQRLFLPGGWLEHAMVYEIVRTEKGFDFIIYNTGAGTGTYHASSIVGSKKKVSPTKIYTVNKSPIDLRRCLDFLIAAQVKPMERVSGNQSDKLYQKIDEELIKLSFSENIARVENSEPYITGQRGGTCAARSVLEAVKQKIIEACPEEYSYIQKRWKARLAKLAIRKMVIAEFVEELEGRYQEGLESGVDPQSQEMLAYLPKRAELEQLGFAIQGLKSFTFKHKESLKTQLDMEEHLRKLEQFEGAFKRLKTICPEITSSLVEKEFEHIPYDILPKQEAFTPVPRLEAAEFSNPPSLQVDSNDNVVQMLEGMIKVAKKYNAQHCQREDNLRAIHKMESLLLEADSKQLPVDIGVRRAYLIALRDYMEEYRQLVVKTYGLRQPARVYGHFAKAGLLCAKIANGAMSNCVDIQISNAANLQRRDYLMASREPECDLALSQHNQRMFGLQTIKRLELSKQIDYLFTIRKLIKPGGRADSGVSNILNRLAGKWKIEKLDNDQQYRYIEEQVIIKLCDDCLFSSGWDETFHVKEFQKKLDEILREVADPVKDSQAIRIIRKAVEGELLRREADCTGTMLWMGCQDISKQVFMVDSSRSWLGPGKALRTTATQALIQDNAYDFRQTAHDDLRYIGDTPIQLQEVALALHAGVGRPTIADYSCERDMRADDQHNRTVARPPYGIAPENLAYTAVDSPNYLQVEADRIHVSVGDPRKNTLVSRARLLQPYTSEQNAVSILMSTFTGENAGALTHIDMRKYFKGILFTPANIIKHLSGDYSIENKENFTALNNYLLKTILYLRDEKKDISAALDIQNVLIELNRYVSKVPREKLKYDPQAIINDVMHQAAGLDICGSMPTSAEKYMQNLNHLQYHLYMKSHVPDGEVYPNDEALIASFVAVYKEQDVYDNLDVELRYQIEHAILRFQDEYPHYNLDALKQARQALRTKIPNSLLYSADFQRIIGNDRLSCTRTNGDKIIYFRNKLGEEFRALQSFGGQPYTLEKQIEGKWYQLKKPTDFKLPGEQRSALPKFLQDSDLQLWCYQSENTAPIVQIYSTRSRQYNYEIANGKVSSVSESKGKLIRVGQIIPLTAVPTVKSLRESAQLNELQAVNLRRISQALGRFEDLDLIVFKIVSDKLIVKMDRYGLQFSADLSTKPLRLRCDSIPGQLDVSLGDDFEKTSELLKSYPHALLLKHDGQYIKAIHPKKYLVRDSSAPARSSSYRSQRLDTGTVIIDKEYGVGDWDFYESEAFCEVAIGKEQAEKIVLEPKTISECLYLAYYHLAKNEVEKAYALLDQIQKQGGFIGTEDELIWINALLNHIDDSKRLGYVYVSFNSKLLAMTTQFQQSSRTWPISHKKSGTGKNIRRHNNLVDELHHCQETLQAQAKISYDKYINLYQNILAHQRLTKDEELALIALYDGKDPIVSFHQKSVEAIRRRYAFSDKLAEPKAEQFSLTTVPAPTLEGRENPIAYLNQWLANFESTIIEDFKSAIDDRLSLEMGHDPEVTMPLILQYYVEGLLPTALDMRVELYLRARIQRDSYEKIIEKKKAIEEAQDKIKKDRLRVEVSALCADALFAFIRPGKMEDGLDDFKNSRFALVFQATQKIRLRREQADILESLMTSEKGDPNKITQLIMGGGKTKIILPYLVKAKSDGKRLPMIVVPEALFDVNLADFNKTSMHAFGQQAVPFIFKREMNYSISDYERMYEQLDSVRKDRNYLLTTPDSMQSLYLKYNELLALDNKTPEGRLERKHVEKMLTLIRKHGHAVVDEVDMVFDNRKLFQYATGPKEVMDKDLTHISLDLFTFINEQMGMVVMQNGTRLPIAKVMDCPQNINGKVFKEELVRALVDAENTPLLKIRWDQIEKSDYDKFKKEFCKQVFRDGVIGKAEENVMQDRSYQQEFFRQVLSNPNYDWDALPDCPLKKQLFIFHEQIHTVLEQTLNAEYNKSYGLSHDKTGSVQESLLAIPYQSANSPAKKGTRFAHQLEEINYALQSALLNPIPASIGLEFIQMMKAMPIDEQRALQRYLGTAIDLTDISANENGKLELVLQDLNKSTRLRMFCIKKLVLDRQKTEMLALSSTPADHFNLYASCLGVTGTPWNITGMPSQLRHIQAGDPSGLNIKDDERVDRLLLSDFCKNVSTYDNADVESLLVNQSDKTRAIIDCGGILHEADNKHTAMKIAEHYRDKPGNEIAFILFFDSDNLLYALDVNDIDADPKLLPTTDEESIASILGIPKENCFTYYDQRHTTGVDIKQMADANAVLTVTEKTMRRDLAQSAMRMRELGRAQTISYAISTEFRIAIDRTDVNTNASIVKHAKDVQDQRLADDEMRGYTYGLDAVFSSTIMVWLQEQVPDDRKADLFKALNAVRSSFVKDLHFKVGPDKTSLAHFMTHMEEICNIAEKTEGSQIGHLIQDSLEEENPRAGMEAAKVVVSQDGSYSKALRVSLCDNLKSYIQSTMKAELLVAIDTWLIQNHIPDEEQAINRENLLHRYLPYIEKFTKAIMTGERPCLDERDLVADLFNQRLEGFYAVLDPKAASATSSLGTSMQVQNQTHTKKQLETKRKVALATQQVRSEETWPSLEQYNKYYDEHCKRLFSPRDPQSYFENHIKAIQLHYPFVLSQQVRASQEFLMSAQGDSEDTLLVCGSKPVVFILVEDGATKPARPPFVLLTGPNAYNFDKLKEDLGKSDQEKVLKKRTVVPLDHLAKADFSQLDDETLLAYAEVFFINGNFNHFRQAVSYIKKPDIQTKLCEGLEARLNFAQANLGIVGPANEEIFSELLNQGLQFKTDAPAVSIKEADDAPKIEAADVDFLIEERERVRRGMAFVTAGSRTIVSTPLGFCIPTFSHEYGRHLSNYLSVKNPNVVENITALRSYLLHPEWVNESDYNSFRTFLVNEMLTFNQKPGESVIAKQIIAACFTAIDKAPKTDAPHSLLPDLLKKILSSRPDAAEQFVVQLIKNQDRVTNRYILRALLNDKDWRETLLQSKFLMLAVSEKNQDAFNLLLHYSTYNASQMLEELSSDELKILKKAENRTYRRTLLDLRGKDDSAEMSYAISCLKLYSAEAGKSFTSRSYKSKVDKVIEKFEDETDVVALLNAFSNIDFSKDKILNKSLFGFIPQRSHLYEALCAIAAKANIEMVKTQGMDDEHVRFTFKQRGLGSESRALLSDMLTEDGPAFDQDAQLLTEALGELDDVAGTLPRLASELDGSGGSQGIVSNPVVVGGNSKKPG